MNSSASIRLCAMAAAALASAGCQNPLDPPRLQRHQDSPPFVGVHPPSPEAEPGAALPALDESAELADYLAYAAANSPAMRAAFHRWRAAVERVPQVTGLPDPMLGYGYFLEDFTARRAMGQHVFELSQTFPWFGKLRLRGDAASLAADAAAHEYEAVRLALFLEIRRAWYELYQLQRALDITRENLALLQQFEAIARAQFRVGTAAHADVVRAQVELGRMEDRVRQLEQLRPPAAARFNAAVGRPALAPVTWPTTLSDERLDPDGPGLAAALARINPRLRAMDVDIERERTETALARRNFYPDVTLGGMYALRGDDPVLLSAMINVPIWPGRYRAAVREAASRRIAAAYSRQDEGRRLEAELQEALYEHDDADRRIALYRDTLLPKARESLQASLGAFQGGTRTFLDLLDAERTLLEFELAASRARTDRALALARLDALVGAPVARITADAAIEQDDTAEELEVQP